MNVLIFIFVYIGIMLATLVICSILYANDKEEDETVIFMAIAWPITIIFFMFALTGYFLVWLSNKVKEAYIENKTK